MVKSTQRLLKGRLTSDDANSTSHTLAWLCTSAAPCLEGGGWRRTTYAVFLEVLHDARHTNWCGVGGGEEGGRDTKVAIPEIRQAWLEQPLGPLAIDRSWPCPGPRQTREENAALRVFYKWVITIFRLKTARLLFGLRSMGKSKKSKLRVSLPNNLLKEIVIVCHGGPLGLKVSQDSTTGHVLIKSFHLLPSGPCHRPFAPSGLSPSTSGSAAPLPWPRYI